MIAMRNVRRGVRNHQRDVMLVQDMLNRECGSNLLVDGDYGGKSEAAVRSLQSNVLHVEPTGIVGQAEWMYLLSDIDVLELRMASDVVWSYDHINYGGKGSFTEQQTDKDIVVLHHTVSGRNAYNVSDYFSTKPYATHFIIGGDGTILQTAPLSWWAWHINMRADDKSISANHERMMARRSIGIEICCWGALNEKDGKLYNSAMQQVQHDNAIYYEQAYVGKHYYEKYTTEQVHAVKILLRALSQHGYYKHDKRDYNDRRWLETDKEAIAGKRGLVSHTNMRAYGSKSDIHPQPDMMQMLCEL